MMKARPLHAREAAERENDAALIFPQDANGWSEKQANDDQREHPTVKYSSIIKLTSFAGAARRPAPNHQRQDPTILATSTPLAGLEGVGAARLPAFTMREDVPFVLGSSRGPRRAGRAWPAAPTRGGPWRARRSAPSTTRNETR